MATLNKHTVTWPKSQSFVQRFQVLDLVPELKKGQELKAIFIGESPHRDEVAPEDRTARSPFRGVAGREWWAELAKFLSYPVVTKPVPPRSDLLKICGDLKVAVLNAVNYPIDPKITLHQGEKSNPRDQLGFEKAAGPFGYKAVYKKPESPARWAIEDLASRLEALKDHSAQLVCLGNDSRWFVELALELLPRDCALLERPLLMVPHPSSWWRNSAYRQRAVDLLKSLLS